MKKVVLTCGLISGAIVSGMMAIGTTLCVKNAGYKSSEVIGYTSMILAFSLVFVGIKMFRDKYNGGSVTFGKAFMVGFYISLIASTMYVLAWSIEYNYIFPDFMDKYSAHMIENAKATGKSQASIDATVKQMDMYKGMYKNPLFFVLLTYAEILPVGLVVSLISALILKIKDKKNVMVAN